MIITTGSALVTAALVAYVTTPLTGRLARRFGVIDHPSQEPTGHKRHTEPTPYLGGIAISLGLVAGSLFVFAATEGIPVRHFVVTIGAGLGLAAVGLVDDITPLPRSLRLIAQVVLAYVAWETGFGVSASPNAAVNLLLTTFWLVGITNAFNLLDNMDGASAGLAGIAALTFAVMGLMSELPLLPIIAAALAGASFGFLVHNRHPARVFMGDAGSLLLGFLVALLGLRLRFDVAREITFLVPVVVLGIPILDTSLVVLSRVRHRRPVFLGGRDHIAHRLVMAGLSTRTAISLMYVTAICLGWLGLVISRATTDVALMLSGFVVVVGLLGAGFLLKVPVYGEDLQDVEPRTVPDLEAVEGLPDFDLDVSRRSDPST
jgi:UDP-GlcNAc:undecaprenyl-phosphate/decaprenyl-phosphate GlcNAc-1-phosphate transferase